MKGKIVEDYKEKSKFKMSNKEDFKDVFSNTYILAKFLETMVGKDYNMDKLQIHEILPLDENKHLKLDEDGDTSSDDCDKNEKGLIFTVKLPLSDANSRAVVKIKIDSEIGKGFSEDNSIFKNDGDYSTNALAQMEKDGIKPENLGYTEIYKVYNIWFCDTFQLASSSKKLDFNSASYKDGEFIHRYISNRGSDNLKMKKHNSSNLIEYMFIETGYLDKTEKIHPIQKALYGEFIYTFKRLFNRTTITHGDLKHVLSSYDGLEEASVGIINRTQWARGIEQGIKQGKEQAKIELIKNCLQKEGLTATLNIKHLFDATEEEVFNIANKMGIEFKG